MDDADRQRVEQILAVQMEQGFDEGTYMYPIKCLNCSLHYTVFSWRKWADLNDKGGYCPECGIRGNKAVWGPIVKNAFIFSLHNPENAPLHSMTAAEQVARFGIGNMAIPEEK